MSTGRFASELKSRSDVTTIHHQWTKKWLEQQDIMKHWNTYHIALSRFLSNAFPVGLACAWRETDDPQCRGHILRGVVVGHDILEGRYGAIVVEWADPDTRQEIKTYSTVSPLNIIKTTLQLTSKV